MEANNLYGCAMSEKVPYSNFKWMSRGEMDNFFDGQTQPSVLEVDIRIPESLHDCFNYYPLATENRKIGKVNKLVSTFYDKEKYIVHYKLLKYYVEKGLVVTKIQRGIKYDEKAFMKDYIDFNTDEKDV